MMHCIYPEAREDLLSDSSSENSDNESTTTRPVLQATNIQDSSPIATMPLAAAQVDEQNHHEQQIPVQATKVISEENVHKYAKWMLYIQVGVSIMEFQIVHKSLSSLEHVFGMANLAFFGMMTVCLLKFIFSVGGIHYLAVKEERTLANVASHANLGYACGIFVTLITMSLLTLSNSQQGLILEEHIPKLTDSKHINVARNVVETLESIDTYLCCQAIYFFICIYKFTQVQHQQ